MSVETREKDGVLQIKVGRYWLALDEYLEQQASELQRARDELAELYEENRKLREPKAEEPEDEEEYEEIRTASGERVIFHKNTGRYLPNSNKIIVSTTGTTAETPIKSGTYTGSVTFSVDPSKLNKDVISKITGHRGINYS